MGRILVVALVGAIAQLIDGTLGMGYGVTSSSLLITFGFYPVIVSASVHMSEIFTSLGSGIFHLRFGNVEKKIFFPLILFGIPGGILGAYCLVKLSLSPLPVKKIVGFVLFLMGCLILFRFLVSNTLNNSSFKKELKFWKLLLLGGFAAFIDAIGGGGWGPVSTSTLIVNRIEPRKAIGSVNLAEFFVTVTMVVTFLILVGPEGFRWGIAGILAVSGLLVSPLAAYLCKKIPARILGILVGIILIFLNLRIFFK